MCQNNRHFLINYSLLRFSAGLTEAGFTTITAIVISVKASVTIKGKMKGQESDSRKRRNAPNGAFPGPLALRAAALCWVDHLCLPPGLFVRASHRRICRRSAAHLRQCNME